MGRVYDVRPDLAKGELPGAGRRCLALGPARQVLGKIMARRVEFDKDEDEGIATVTAYLTTTTGEYLRTRFGAVVTTFRALVRIVPVSDPKAEEVALTADPPVVVQG